MAKPREPSRCKECGAVTATPIEGLCTICYENGVMLGLDQGPDSSRHRD